MDNKKIEEMLKQVFLNNGIEISLGEEDEDLELDSLQTIALYVDIENTFEIEIPEEYLSDENLLSFRNFYELLTILKPLD